MGVVRTILVFLIALSVALLPAAGTVAAAASAHLSATQDLTQGLQESPAVAPDDCAHDQAPCCDHGSKTMGDCPSMATCPAKCFNYTGAVLPDLLPTPAGSTLEPMAASDLVVSKTGSPPFRPPRV
ncbi:MAG: hypothetical protein IRZ09_06465 [Variibacter sp.]|nr:hypothetical protein [Variibacter sp.]